LNPVKWLFIRELVKYEIIFVPLMLVALAHLSSHYSTPTSKLNTDIIEGVGGSQTNQAHLIKIS